MLSGKGFVATIRHRHGARIALGVAFFLVVANFGTICAEFAGIAAAGTLAGVPAHIGAPVGAVVVAGLVVLASFHRVEHILLAVSALLASYVVAGFFAHPDWGAVASGLAVPTLPTSEAGLIAVTATIGTTLAPWGLAFIQSYAVDKGIDRTEWMPERVEIIVGSLLTGVIGVFIAVTCAAVLRPAHVDVRDAHEAAKALAPLAGDYATVLFGVGLLGAGLLGAALVPLATAYSVAEGFDRPSTLDDGARADPLFYGVFVGLVVMAAAIVAIPGVPLLPLIYATQLINALLLPPQLFLLLKLNRDPEVVGKDRLPPWALYLGSAGMLTVIAAVVALGVVQVLS
jgi:Mn2+/Fe2+ NRAMP family transporter